MCVCVCVCIYIYIYICVYIYIYIQLHWHNVVAIEKEAFWSLLTMVGQLIYNNAKSCLYIYIKFIIYEQIVWR